MCQSIGNLFPFIYEIHSKIPFPETMGLLHPELFRCPFLNTLWQSFLVRFSGRYGHIAALLVAYNVIFEAGFCVVLKDLEIAANTFLNPSGANMLWECGMAFQVPLKPWAET